jgi:hypothetical protein
LFDDEGAETTRWPTSLAAAVMEAKRVDWEA